MRYNSALVLGALAVGQASAVNVRHASFHARRVAESKRDGGYQNFDVEKMAKDLKTVNWDEALKNVDWNTVNYNQPTATPAPEPKKEEAKPTSSAAPVVAAQAEKTEEAAPAKTEESKDIGDVIEDIVGDFMQGVDAVVSRLGLKGPGVNDEKANGAIWLGDDSEWKMQFINDASDDVVVVCWKKDGFKGMFLQDVAPQISVGLKSGQKATVSFAAQAPAACAPIWGSTGLNQYGQIDNTWLEMTMGEHGRFDVSREVNMVGTNISAKGSKCTSSMDTCVYKCKNESAKICGTSTNNVADYALFGMNEHSGCTGAHDDQWGGDGGGCEMGVTGETVVVTLSK